jgi:hypothetical protein
MAYIYPETSAQYSSLSHTWSAALFLLFFDALSHSVRHSLSLSLNTPSTGSLSLARTRSVQPLSLEVDPGRPFLILSGDSPTRLS